MIRRVDLGGMDDLKALMFISFLLSYRWADNHRGEPDGKTGFLGLAGCIAEADKMRTTRFDAGHDLRDGGVAGLGQPVDAGADQEICPQLTGKAEEFIDVACLMKKSAPRIGRSHCPPRHSWRAVAAVGS